MRNTLAGEESQVDLLKSQLKQLFRFSEDSRHLSDDVLAVVKEHQRYCMCPWALQGFKLPLSVITLAVAVQSAGGTS